MSDGIRSGVNWMRRASSPSTMPMVSTSLVLARPGTPTSSAWPPDSTVTSARSTTLSWPKITAPMAALAARTCAAVDSAARTIMSSSFSRLSPPAAAMISFLSCSLRRFEPPAALCNKRTSDLCAQTAPNLPHSAWPSLRYLLPPGRLSHEVANRRATRLNYRRENNGEGRAGDANWTASTASLAPRSSGKGPPPVQLWNPPFCGDIDMRIAADGTWFYLKTPIGRPALVKLFASVLKREGDKYFLVTPVEKVGHRRRRRAVPGGRDEGRGRARGSALSFRTNVDDWVDCRARPRAALRAGAGDRRAQALSACPARPVGAR